jgi:hypothetical protein
MAAVLQLRTEESNGLCPAGLAGFSHPLALAQMIMATAADAGVVSGIARSRILRSPTRSAGRTCPQC